MDRDIDVVDKEGEHCDPEVEFLGRKAEIGRMYVENEKLVKRLDMHGPPDFEVFIQRQMKEPFARTCRQPYK